MMFEMGLLTSKSLLFPLCLLPLRLPTEHFEHSCSFVLVWFCLLEALKVCHIITNTYMISPARTTQHYRMKGAQNNSFHEDLAVITQYYI